MANPQDDVPAPRLATIALLVHDYDDARRWYRDALGFGVVGDEPLDAEPGAGPAPPKRWVVLEPGDGAPRAPRLLLARASDDEQRAAVGRQGGGRVWLFFETRAFDRDLARLRAAGALIEDAAPRHEPYGTVIVFRDLYGNRCDLIQPRDLDRADRPRIDRSGS